MRRIGVVLGLVGAILIVAVGAIWVLADPNRHRDLIQTQLEGQLGRKVTLGTMSLGLLPLRFQIENPVIAEDPRFATKQPFIRAEKLDIRIGLFALLGGNVQVSALELRRPSVELIRSKQGKWNFLTLGETNAAANPQNATKGGREFSLGRLTILDGQVGVTDLQQKGARTAYDHIDLTLLDYTPGKRFSFDVAAHIQGEGAQEVRLKGEGGPVSAGNPADTPFNGMLNLNRVAIAGLLKSMDAKTDASGVLSGESQITSKSGDITTTGKLKLEKARFNRVDIGYPILFDYNLSAKAVEGLIKIDTATLQLGQTPLSVSGTLNTSKSPVNVDLRIKSGDVSIAEVARLASAFGLAFAPGAIVTGRVRADVQAKGSADKPALTGTISGRDLQISGQGIPQPVAVKAINLGLSPTAIQSDEFNATSGKTTLVARFAMMQYTSNSPSLDAALRAPGATLPEIQSIAKAYGITGLDQLSGDGSLNFDLRANGPLQSLNSASATRALNGVINVDFSPLKILGFDTAHELARLGGFASGLNEQNATDIIKVAGQILVKDGIVQTDNLKAQLGVGKLDATGTADLTSEVLNLKLAAIFTKAFSDKVTPSRAANFMNAAFSNSAGEIVLPAIVTGTFKQPKFTPDVRALAQLQKQKFIPTLDNPTGAIGNVLGVLKGKSNTDGQDQPAGGKPSVVKGILGVLGGKTADQPK